MKLSTAHKIGRFFQYFVLILVGVIMIYPLVWMVGATFKSNAEIFAGIGFLTANPTLQGYIDAVTQNYGGDISIWRAFINTYSFVIPKVIFTVISSVIAAYGFSRFKFKGRDMLFGIMISTLFLPQVVLNVPQYLMYNSFGWINRPFTCPCGCPPCLRRRPTSSTSWSSSCAASPTIWTRLPPSTAAARSRSCTRSSPRC